MEVVAEVGAYSVLAAIALNYFACYLIELESINGEGGNYHEVDLAQVPTSNLADGYRNSGLEVGGLSSISRKGRRAFGALDRCAIFEVWRKELNGQALLSHPT